MIHRSLVVVRIAWKRCFINEFFRNNYVFLDGLHVMENVVYASICLQSKPQDFWSGSGSIILCLFVIIIDRYRPNFFDYGDC